MVIGSAPTWRSGEAGGSGSRRWPSEISPQAPTHLLVIPRQGIERLSEAEDGDEELLGHLLRVATRVARDAGLSDFRVVVNDGAGAGQTVFHLHLHVLGGRPLRWPPG